MIQLLLSAGLVFIMFDVGLTLTAGNFLDVARMPRAVATGLVAQSLALPLIAVTLLAAWPMPGDMALGVLLLAAAPGGVTANLLTLLAHGNVALALVITALSTLLATLTLPLVLHGAATVLGLDAVTFAMPVAAMAKGILFTTVVPLLVGMLLRARWPATTLAVEPMLRKIATSIFALIVITTFVSNAEAFRVHTASVGPVVLTLNALAMLAAVALAAMARLDRAARIAITFETGLQNAALAIFIAIGILERPALAIPAVIYAVAMNITALALLAVLRRASARRVTKGYAT